MGDHIFSFYRNVTMKTFPCFIAVAIFMVNISGSYARPKIIPFEPQAPQAEKEREDLKEATGQYSYVDLMGALITVTYTAGPNGYTEDRTVQEGFLSKGLRASKEPSNPQGLKLSLTLERKLTECQEKSLDPCEIDGKEYSLDQVKAALPQIKTENQRRQVIIRRNRQRQRAAVQAERGNRRKPKSRGE